MRVAGAHLHANYQPAEEAPHGSRPRHPGQGGGECASRGSRRPRRTARGTGARAMARGGRSCGAADFDAPNSGDGCRPLRSGVEHGRGHPPGPATAPHPLHPLPSSRPALSYCKLPICAPRHRFCPREGPGVRNAGRGGSEEDMPPRYETRARWASTARARSWTRPAHQKPAGFEGFQLGLLQASPPHQVASPRSWRRWRHGPRCRPERAELIDHHWRHDVCGTEWEHDG